MINYDFHIPLLIIRLGGYWCLQTHATAEQTKYFTHRQTHTYTHTFSLQ